MYVTAQKIPTAIFVVILCVCGVLEANEADYITVVASTDWQDYWVIDQLPAWRRLTMQEKKAGKPGCVSVAFVIESDGTTTSHKVVGSFPNDKFNEVVIHQLKRARFDPAKSNEKREPIYTVITTNMSPIIYLNKVLDEESAVLSKKVSEVCSRKVNTWFSRLNFEALAK